MQERPSGTQEWPEKTSNQNRRLELLADEERNGIIEFSPIILLESFWYVQKPRFGVDTKVHTSKR